MTEAYRKCDEREDKKPNFIWMDNLSVLEEAERNQTNNNNMRETRARCRRHVFGSNAREIPNRNIIKTESEVDHIATFFLSFFVTVADIEHFFSIFFLFSSELLLWMWRKKKEKKRKTNLVIRVEKYFERISEKQKER